MRGAKETTLSSGLRGEAAREHAEPVEELLFGGVAYVPGEAGGTVPIDLVVRSFKGSLILCAKGVGVA